MANREKTTGTHFIGDHSKFDGFAYCMFDGTKHVGRPRRTVGLDEDFTEHDPVKAQIKEARLQYLQNLPDFCLLLKMFGDAGVTYRQLADELKSNPGSVYKQRRSYFRSLVDEWMHSLN